MKRAEAFLEFRKHPRIRGENGNCPFYSDGDGETSPHTRGELETAFWPLTMRGNIPAYAGRTTSAEVINRPPQKHPRIRGENRLALRQDDGSRETSPHTRGERCPLKAAEGIFRNIPAYAGRTATY